MECPGSDHPCGTPRAWVNGCRNPPCEQVIHDLRTTYRNARWQRVERLKVDLPEGTDHGTYAGAHTYGCGCNPCKEARNAYQAARQVREPRRAQ